MFSTTYHKQGEDNQLSDGTELCKNLNFKCNLTETDINKIAIIFPIKNQIQKHGTKYSGWRFDKNNAMTIDFWKTTELNG